MRPVLSAIVAVVASSLLACDSGPAPSPRPVSAKPAPTAAAAKPAEEAKPAIVAAVAYAYNPTAKRDPFRPPDELRSPLGADGASACTEPLCQWDINDLDLRAVVTGDASPFAMVIDPKGRGYIVRRNTRIGRQGGRVTQILREQITVTEVWMRPDGKRDEVAKEIRIAPDKGSSDPEIDLITGKTFE